ncbi:DUF6452 family protein [Gillisia sp. M10.2A]|uniref:DUF6452 family protein n=1 Tax=Gillisia lutea TaxID=2909668 RepID=A0ABS9EIT6_9FLAO|nr:DUF6452 family protein [Gillisia lutea]MCF4102769.1 DUF6452 family protein [Gillisia lutea]
MLRIKIKMKSLYKVALGLSGIILLSLGCQRDDICSETTQTTSRLVLSFYDADNVNVLKAPPNMNVKATDNDSLLFETINQNNIAIPLKTDGNSTEYEFIINAEEEDDEPSVDINSDIVQFTYARSEEYISRACSYKVVYSNLNAVLTSEPNSNWIKNIVIEESNIEDETTTHISIYH